MTSKVQIDQIMLMDTFLKDLHADFLASSGRPSGPLIELAAGCNQQLVTSTEAGFN